MATNTRILVINPGSTSTKIAIYQQEKVIFLKTIKHSPDQLRRFEKITDQYEYRKDIIYDELKSADVPVESIDAVIGRGGRSEEHTSELQSRPHLVCRLLLEKKKKQ